MRYIIRESELYKGIVMKMLKLVVVLINMVTSNIAYANTIVPESTIKPSRIIHVETDWATMNRSDVLVLCIDKQEFVIRDNVIIQVFTFDEKDRTTKPKPCKSNN